MLSINPDIEHMTFLNIVCLNMNLENKVTRVKAANDIKKGKGANVELSLTTNYAQS